LFNLLIFNVSIKKSLLYITNSGVFERHGACHYMGMFTPVANDQIYSVIKTLLIEAKEKVYRHINFTMVTTYWNIGRIIVEEEQRGKDKAEYGEYLIKYFYQFSSYRG